MKCKIRNKVKKFWEEKLKKEWMRKSLGTLNGGRMLRLKEGDEV